MSDTRDGQLALMMMLTEVVNRLDQLHKMVEAITPPKASLNDFITLRQPTVVGPDGEAYTNTGD